MTSFVPIIEMSFSGNRVIGKPYPTNLHDSDSPEGEILEENNEFSIVKYRERELKVKKLKVETTQEEDQRRN